MGEALEYVDPQGIKWHPFTVSYKHEIDNQSFSFTIWAVDHADAVERLQYIRENGKVDGQVVGYEEE